MAQKYGSLLVAIFNLKCNMKNDNAICKMAMYLNFNFPYQHLEQNDWLLQIQ